jgi:hypothetical protein
MNKLKLYKLTYSGSINVEGFCEEQVKLFSGIFINPYGKKLFFTFDKCNVEEIPYE